MKNAAVFVVLAGMVGAAWYKNERVPETGLTKLQIPDPGPLEEADQLAEAAPEWNPQVREVTVPKEPESMSHVANRFAEVQTVSDEQVFATTEDPFENDVRPTTESAVVREPEESPLAKLAERDWQSVDGRPIAIRVMGTGSQRTVILTGIDGRDRTAVQWSDELVDYLEQRSDVLQQQTFVFIRAANPDGLAAKKQVNNHGVVLNRNFPTRRYQTDASGKAGSGPASEPETRAILQTLYEVDPQRIIHLSSTTGRSGAYHNSLGKKIAQRIEAQHRITDDELDFDLVPGSLEEFADATWEAQVVRLNLKGVPEDELTSRIMPVLLTAISVLDTATVSHKNSPRESKTAQTSHRDHEPTSSPVPVVKADSPERRKRPVKFKGYQEIPPPPK